MGLLDPTPPPFEVEEWRRRPHLQRIKALAQDWALNGFGTPVAVYFLYVFKILVYAGLGFLLIDGQQLGKPAQIVAAIVAFAILGKATDWLIVLLSAPFLRWEDRFARV